MDVAEGQITRSPSTARSTDHALSYFPTSLGACSHDGGKGGMIGWVQMGQLFDKTEGDENDSCEICTDTSSERQFV